MGLVYVYTIDIDALKNKGIFIGTHIKSCAGILDRDFGDIYEDIKTLNCPHSDFYKKVEVLRKLTNIRNYFGKPKHFCDGVVIKCTNSYCGVETGQFYFDKPDLDSLHEVVFAKREHAEQAIKMLGDELKYLFEPW